MTSDRPSPIHNETQAPVGRAPACLRAIELDGGRRLVDAELHIPSQKHCVAQPVPRVCYFGTDARDSSPLP